MKSATLRRKIGNVLSYVALIIWFVFIAIVLYLVVVNAMKTQEQSAQGWLELPSSFYFGNFIEVVSMDKFKVALRNTLIFSGIGIIVVTFFVPAVSYALNMTNKLKISRFTLYYFVAAMFVPFQVVALPLAIYLNNLGLGKFWSIVLIFITYPLIQGVYLCNGYLKTIPRDLAESAFVEGAGVWQTFFKIIFPIMKPMTSTIIIINFLWMWNEFMISLFVLGGNREWMTLPLFIYNFKGQYSIQYNLLFAAIVLTSLPLTAVYIFLQKYIVAGLAGGAVKG